MAYELAKPTMELRWLNGVLQQLCVIEIREWNALQRRNVSKWRSEWRDVPGDPQAAVKRPEQSAHG